MASNLKKDACFTSNKLSFMNRIMCYELKKSAWKIRTLLKPTSFVYSSYILSDPECGRSSFGNKNETLMLSSPNLKLFHSVWLSI